MPTRATVGTDDSAEPRRSCSSERSPSFWYDAEMRLALALTFPSPDVSALSANDGPNVVAVRTRSPVAGSSLNAKPAEEVPNGVVATSSAVAKLIASPAAGLAIGAVSGISVSESDRSGHLADRLRGCGCARDDQAQDRENTYMFA